MSPADDVPTPGAPSAHLRSAALSRRAPENEEMFGWPRVILGYTSKGSEKIRTEINIMKAILCFKQATFRSSEIAIGFFRFCFKLQLKLHLLAVCSATRFGIDPTPHKYRPGVAGTNTVLYQFFLIKVILSSNC